MCNWLNYVSELVLKVRVGNGGDPDFIEIEIPRNELTYYSLLRVCCEELGLNASQVFNFILIHYCRPYFPDILIDII